MDHLSHRAPSVGSILKKLIAVNPNLNTSELIAIVRESIEKQSSLSGDFVQAEVINESKALELTLKTLGNE